MEPGVGEQLGPQGQKEHGGRSDHQARGGAQTQGDGTPRSQVDAGETDNLHHGADGTDDVAHPQLAVVAQGRQGQDGAGGDGGEAAGQGVVGRDAHGKGGNR